MENIEFMLNLLGLVLSCETVVVFLQVIYDKTIGRNRGLEFVTMSTTAEVEVAAHKFNGYVSFSIKRQIDTISMKTT